MRSITNENSRFYWKAFSEQEKVDSLSSKIKFLVLPSSYRAIFIVLHFRGGITKIKGSRAHPKISSRGSANVYVYAFNGSVAMILVIRVASTIPEIVLCAYVGI